MLTLFTTAKPFHGHSAIIQRNALKSWTLLHPDVEVILFGDDDGAAETARELRLRYEPYVSRSEHGSKRLDYMFSTARAVARHDILCYVNCDIILMDDFLRALKRVREKHMNFLMVGRRWDIEMPEPVDYLQASWRSRLQGVALMRGVQRSEEWIDYFAFSKGLYGASVPPLVVGRIFWDDWLVWKAMKLKAAVVDASDAVIAVHQNHDYSYHPKGKHGMWNDVESVRNLEIGGGYGHLRSIKSAPFRLTYAGLRRNLFSPIAYPKWTARRVATTYFMRAEATVQTHVWHPLLNATRNLRHQIGIRQGGLEGLRRRPPRIG
jgi:hypothetical protein